MSSASLPTVQDVLKFWFVDHEYADWYKKDADFDREIRDKFLPLHTELHASRLDSWIETPEGALAAIIVLDQFSRNMFRDKPEAFASDSKAIWFSKEAIRRGYVEHFANQKMKEFVVVPHMHSEHLDDHAYAMQFYTRPGWEKILKYELEHKGIIERFGRYPHRNPILGRQDAPEEVEFMKTPPKWI